MKLERKAELLADVIHTNPTSNTSDPHQALRSKLSESLTEEQLRSLLTEHGVVLSSQDTTTPKSGECYAVYSNGKGYLVEIETPALQADKVRLRLWHNAKNLAPIPLEKWQSSASRARVQLISFQREAVDSVDHPSNPSLPPVSEHVAAVSPDSPVPEKIVSDTAERDQILDMGAFTQLLDAAQRSGIVQGLNNIVQVRDCEFRLGKYNKALQIMESMYSSFMAAESQRNQRLQREYAEIASGRRKMSPKELQAKRVQDNHATQAIERAQTRFQRVLEGLRGIMHLERQKPSEPSES